MRILVDLDEITADLIGEWVRLYNEEWNDCLTREQITDWEIHKFVKPECGKKIYQILHRPGLFESLPPHKGAIKGIGELLGHGHTVKFATSSPTAESCRGKVHWVDRYFADLGLTIHDVIMVYEKVWLAPSVDVLIDDKPSTIVEWREYSDKMRAEYCHAPEILSIAHPYNEHVGDKAHLYAQSYKDTEGAWEQIVDHILTMSRREGLRSHDV